MKRAERLSAILDLLAGSGRIDVEEIVERLDVSPATARRDLDLLDEQQLLSRTRGGAVTHSVAYDLPLRYKNQQQTAEKIAIARAASAMVPRGSVIALSGGTTTTAIADELMSRPDVQEPSAEPGLTVVTNAVNIAMALATRPQIKTVLTGGVLHSRSYEVVGTFSEIVLGEMNFDFAFIGANGLCVETGASAHDERESAVNRAMASRAAHAVLAVDASKLGVRTFATIGDAGLFPTVITDSAATSAQRAALTEAGYRLIIGDEGRIGE